MVDIIYIVISFLVFIGSVILHEIMHAYASYWLGDDTAKHMGRLSFNPIKHIDPFLSILLPLSLAITGAPIFGGAKPVPFNPYKVRYGEWGALIVAIAGPLTNLFLAFITFGLYVTYGSLDTDIVSYILIITFRVNIGLFIFNMIPIPPLDGSRVMYALAPEFIKSYMQAIERYGIMLVFGILFLFNSAFSMFMANAILWFIQVFSTIFGV